MHPKPEVRPVAGRPARTGEVSASNPRSTSDRAGTPPGAPVVIKKYANRRLYNTEASSYVTLEDLAGMVRLGRDFIVFDAKSSEDITRGVLTQIIVEEESKGRSLLPESFLRQLIAFYGDSLQAVVPRYLEFAMAGFTRQQEQMRKSMEQAMGGFMPAFPGLEEMSKQNLAMLDRAMALFTPFRPQDAGREAGGPDADPAHGAPPSPGPRPTTDPPSAHDTPSSPDPLAAPDMLGPVNALNAEIERLKLQLAAMNAAATRTSD